MNDRDVPATGCILIEAPDVCGHCLHKTVTNLFWYNHMSTVSYGFQRFLGYSKTSLETHRGPATACFQGKPRYIGYKLTVECMKVRLCRHQFPDGWWSCQVVCWSKSTLYVHVRTKGNEYWQDASATADEYDTIGIYCYLHLNSDMSERWHSSKFPEGRVNILAKLCQCQAPSQC